MNGLGVIWSAAGLLLATHSAAVVEVLPPVSCRPAPGVPHWVRGLFAHRARLIPLVDAARLLGAERAPQRMFNRVIVVRVSSEHMPIDWPVGLWVERVLDLEYIDFDAAGGHPGFATETGRFLGPVVQTRWGQVQLVKPAELFSPEQAEVLTQRLSEAAA